MLDHSTAAARGGSTSAGWIDPCCQKERTIHPSHCLDKLPAQQCSKSQTHHIRTAPRRRLSADATRGVLSGQRRSIAQSEPGSWSARLAGHLGRIRTVQRHPPSVIQIALHGDPRSIQTFSGSVKVSSLEIQY
eukprot:5353751-Prymnesium_polylepis.1